MKSRIEFAVMTSSVVRIIVASTLITPGEEMYLAIDFDIGSRSLSMALAIVVGAGCTFLFFLCDPKLRYSLIATSSIISTGAVYLLGVWKAEIGPAVGFFWVMGLAFGFVVGLIIFILIHIAQPTPLPAGHNMRMSGVVLRHLLTKGLAQAELSINEAYAALLTELSDQKNQGRRGEREALVDSIDALHDAVHFCRDELGRFHAGRRLRGMDEDEMSHWTQATLVGLVEKLLEIFAPLFKEEDRIWIAVRMFRKGVEHGEYDTIIRRGACSQDRNLRSISIPEHDGLAKELREMVRKSKPIMEIDRSKRCKYWVVSNNDQLGEDMSIMAAPVFLHNGGEKIMIFILYLNSPSVKLFSRKHRILLKCCSDIVSLFIGEVVSADVSGKKVV